MSRRGIRIASVVGARPQFVKAAMVAEALVAAGADHLLIHTGQHYDWAMSEVFFRDLELPPPDHSLAIGSGSHGAQTGAMLTAIEGVMRDDRPDWVVVYGDTNSTLAGALAAAKLRIRVAHVEAGLRSFNRRMPEELNRVLTDHASDLLFAPTKSAVANLAREGILDDRVMLVGDVMYDAALRFTQRGGPTLERLGLSRGGYVLATVHRAENTDDARRLEAIFRGLAEVAESTQVIVPLHPRTAKALEEAGLSGDALSRLWLLAPQGYLDMLALESAARLIVTDSGGVQKEAFFQRVPCVTVRDETEWLELVELGWNEVVAPTSVEAVASAVRAALEARRPAAPIADPYGGGEARLRIARRLLEEPGVA